MGPCSPAKTAPGGCRHGVCAPSAVPPASAGDLHLCSDHAQLFHLHADGAQQTSTESAQHAPPFPLEGAAAEACDCSGGCLAFVVEARHVAAPERVDAVAWALLTLHAHIDMHVKRFKASL